MKLIDVRFACVVALCAALTVGAQIKTADAAQPADATASGSPSATEATQGDALQEVVVTAERRSERLQSVPVAVTAATAAKLAAVGITTTQDVSLITPGLTMPQTAEYTLPHIRGGGSSAVGPGLESPVATYIDGVYIHSAPSALLSLRGGEILPTPCTQPLSTKLARDCPKRWERLAPTG